MGLTPGKKINAIFITLMGVTFVTGGLILYWLLIFTLTNQKVLNVRAPSMIESERFLRYYGLATGGLRGFIASGEEKYIHDFEKAKAGIQESYKILERLSKKWVMHKNTVLLYEIGGYLEKFYLSSNQVIIMRNNPENDYHVGLKYLREDLAPLVIQIQERIDTLGHNMLELLEVDTQITLELQRLMWFIALSAIIVSTITGTLLLVFNIKYLILYWPRKTFVSSRI